MTPSAAPAASRRAAPALILPLIGAALVLAALAISMPVNHDEGQYVAPALLAGRLRPFADFMYLQTPLQLYLTAPLAGLAHGWCFLALRLANAAMAWGVLVLAYAAQRRLGVPRGRALATTALLLLAYPFEFAAAIARNDALPALLEAGALLAAVVAMEPARKAWPFWTLAGLLLGAAASAKLSYVLPLGATGLFLLWSAWRGSASLASLIGCGLGAVAGLLPIALAWLGAPEPFVWGVFTFAEAAAPYWYRLVGQGARLALPARAGEGLFHLAVGPALAVFVGVVAAAVARRGGPVSAAERFLQVLALAGLVAALAPSPMQRQYFLPMLPPLFVLWGLSDPLGTTGAVARKILLALVAIGAAVGIGRAGYVLAGAALGLAQGREPPALALTAEAHWIGRTLAAAGREGPVVTPSPQAVVDSGAPLDVRFATGAFAYRSGDMLAEPELRRLHLASPGALGRLLDEAPPAAMVTGYEPSTGRLHRNLDDDFRAYGRARGYRRLASPDGRAELWIRPRGLLGGLPQGRSPSPRPGP